MRGGNARSSNPKLSGHYVTVPLSRSPAHAPRQRRHIKSRESTYAGSSSKAFATAFGFREITVSNTCAARSGRCVPCSQSRSVPSGMWKRAANSSCVNASSCRMAATSGIRRARFSRALVAGRQSGSALAAASRFAALIASNRDQSACGGLFGSSLNFVIALFFMTYCTTCRNDADCVSAKCTGDEQQSPVDHSDYVEPEFVVGGVVVDFKNVWIEKDARSRQEIQVVLLEVCLLLCRMPLEVHSPD